VTYSPQAGDGKSELLLGLHNEADELSVDVRFFYIGISGLILALALWIMIPAPFSTAEVGFLITVSVGGLASLRLDLKRRLRIRVLRDLIESESASSGDRTGS
jgi:hypothetical protein